MSGDKTRRSVPGSGTARGDSLSPTSLEKNEIELSLSIPDLELQPNTAYITILNKTKVIISIINRVICSYRSRVVHQ